MRLASLTIAALIPLSSIVSAQGVQTPRAPANAELVVARLMSFDRNNDGRVAKDELPDRMLNLISGDASRDGALDLGEIRAMVAVPRSTTITGAGFPGGYMFGDQFELSSRSRVLGAFDDLRLQDSVREGALPIVTRFMDELERQAAAALLKDMEILVTTNQLARLTAAVDGQVDARLTTALSSMIRQFNLPSLHHGLALDALKTFKERLRFGDAQRTALVDELKGTLTDEERDNFRAALERRPLMKGPSALAFSDAVVVPRTIVKDGLFVVPFTPEPRVLHP
jgi:hypothetical protein